MFMIEIPSSFISLNSHKSSSLHIHIQPHSTPSAALPSSGNNASNSKSEKRKCGNLLERRSDRGRVLRQAVTLFSFFGFAINSLFAKIKAKLKRIIRKIEPLLVYRRTFRITKRFYGHSADVRQRTNLVLCTPVYTLCTQQYCRYAAL